jgi:hypothetical protein
MRDESELYCSRMITTPEAVHIVTNHRFDRREFLKRTGMAFLGAGIAAGTGRSQVPADANFSFIAINDTHYKDEKCAEYFEAAFGWIKENLAFDFALIAGDLTTAAALGELRAIKELTQLLGKPTFSVMGNHDCPQSQDNWISVFGADSVNFRFDHKGWTFLGLDSCNGAKSSDVSVPSATVDWLTSTLPDVPKERPLIAFTHFPFGEGVTYRLVNADAVLALFADHNLKHIFSGHFHGLTERKSGDIGLTTNRCLSLSRGNHDGSKEKGLFHCSVRGEQLSYRFVEFKYEV